MLVVPILVVLYNGGSILYLIDRRRSRAVMGWYRAPLPPVHQRGAKPKILTDPSSRSVCLCFSSPAYASHRFDGCHATVFIAALHAI